MKHIFEELRVIENAIAAKGWPHYKDDPELCMSRYREYVDARDVLMAKHGTTWEAFRATW